jgi:L-amino acid N-acyltransferase YncA
MSAITHRTAIPTDLPRIVEIYNSSIPGRLATADLVPVTVVDRAVWFRGHQPGRRPIWMAERDGETVGWLSFTDFYGRAAYGATAELSVYVDPSAHRTGVAQYLVAEAVEAAPSFGVSTLLGFVFDHNEPSLRLFESFGFARWAHLPGVAALDGIERGLVIVGRRIAP